MTTAWGDPHRPHWTDHHHPAAGLWIALASAAASCALLVLLVWAVAR